MYCPNCGAKNNDSAKFCNECGCKFVTTTIMQNNTTTPIKEQPKKSKEEYIRELEQKDGGYTAGQTFKFIFLILSLVLGLCGALKMNKSGFSESAPLLTFAVVCFLIFILIGAYLMHKNNQFRDLYEKYLRGENITNANPTNKTDSKNKAPHYVGERYWECPNCGKSNDYYITTCKCGERKP
ncbi:MAG: zinc-ribbon domain-containing protein [Ruminococcus sp.]|nr:zinc-ribbon domain-containing protein [Ruminococcus sp.]